MQTTNSLEVVEQVVLIPLELIQRMQDQPRKDFDQTELEAFAENLKEQGQRIPAIVREIDENKFELISGERRWRSCAIAGIPKLKCIIRPKELTGSDQYIEAVIANCHDIKLSIQETALAVGHLTRKLKKTPEEIRAIFGKRSTNWVQMHLKILELDHRVLRLTGPSIPEEKRIPLSTALQIVELPKKEQLGFAELIVAEGLSAQQVRHLVRNRLAQSGTPKEVRFSAEFRSTLKFFRKTNTNIEQFVDHDDNRILLLFKNRNRREADELVTAVKDCWDNLGLTLKVFQEHAQKIR